MSFRIFCGCHKLRVTPNSSDEENFPRMSSTTKDTENRNQQINKQIEKDWLASQNVIKILLLGDAESGKTTIFKQMKLLHLNGFTAVDIINFRYLIYRNIIQAVAQLIDACNILHISISPKIQDDVNLFTEYFRSTPPTEMELNPKLTESIKRIYDSETVRDVLRKYHQIVLLDSALYFLNALQRISEVNYEPTTQDILRCRVATTGIKEIEFPYKNATMRMIDIGGQRSEQRKWIHLFDRIDGIVFVIDISSYNVTVYDNGETMNRLQHGIQLFRKVINNKCFAKNTAMIIFFNKVDLFKKKLRTVPFQSKFRNFTGDNTYEAVTKFVNGLLHEVVEPELRQSRQLFVHFTTATDTSNIDRVFESCTDAVFQTYLEKFGLAD